MEPTHKVKLEPQRQVWVDIAKLFAISLVVFGHSWRGLNNGDLIANPFLFTVIDNSIYYFHIPIFFMVSGFLFFSSAQKCWKDILFKQAKNIIWPYVLWSIITITIKYFFVTSAHVDINNLSDIYRIIYEPFGLFWFLYALLLFQIVIKLTSGRFNSVYLMMLCGLILHVTSYFLNLNTYNIIHLSAYFMIFFILEYVAAKVKIIERVRAQNIHALSAGILFLTVQALCFYMQIELFTGFASIAGLVMALCILVLCDKLGKVQFWQNKNLLYFSSAVYVIYLTHVIFTAGTRIILMNLGVENILLHAVLGTILGILMPLIGFYLAQTLKLSPILGFGPILKQQYYRNSYS